ncbi:ATP-binding cassette domain-containing protein [Oceanispirochaeta crateris]|uniref:ATP-binding cassette domain-containing protein n=1 Tax=Oceanispirochaeta crateris TaxID=2518645 RepID=A0A5C1QK88_9SPIO|nr:ATP-binding cassette domain-containing protein [Oceanispirochaeta crateris]QEN08011.1 ATP-binding cassette domain-containing protein [Oceanispirochaeta crateris]
MKAKPLISLIDQYLPAYPGKGKGPLINWTWNEGESWVILGENGSGKTNFSELIAAQMPGKTKKVSFEDLEDLLEQQIQQDDSEYTGRVDTGTALYEFLGLDQGETLPTGTIPPPAGLEKLMNSGLRILSTGEIRKSLIYKALLENPDLLILDEPFDGLDKESVLQMQEMIQSLITEGIPVLMILNRKSEILPCHSHVAVFREFQIVFEGSKEEWIQFDKVDIPLQQNTMKIPGAPGGSPKIKEQTLVEIRNTTVRYGEKIILDRINWQVKKGEHWKITGPNGAGKSTLLGLITGDQPQAYANDIRLFGKPRGSGESIWEIKEKLGIISPALQLSYRVSLTARMCIVSGLYDSIGIYNSVPPRERALADEWLRYIGMFHKAETPIKKLSYGEQRLLLIARGLIKHPALLILDEPCQGLDDRNRERILDVLGNFAGESETTLLYVTHHEEDKIRHIDRHLRFCPQDGGFTLTSDAVPLPQ